MYRQNSEYYISKETPKCISKLIRHQRYIDSKNHKFTVPYYDNILTYPNPTDYQLIAMRAALKRMRTDFPKRYGILFEFYFVENISVKEYAKKNGISFQAMYKKLNICRSVLRKLSYEELDKLL